MTIGCPTLIGTPTTQLLYPKKHRGRKMIKAVWARGPGHVLWDNILYIW